MGMIKWVKPSGLKIETNDLDVTVEYCESMGWKQENGKQPRKKKKVTENKDSKETENSPDPIFPDSTRITDNQSESN